jgi:hypothetical protein
MRRSRTKETVVLKKTIGAAWKFLKIVLGALLFLLFLSILPPLGGTLFVQLLMVSFLGMIIAIPMLAIFSILLALALKAFIFLASDLRRKRSFADSYVKARSIGDRFRESNRHDGKG